MPSQLLDAADAPPRVPILYAELPEGIIAVLISDPAACVVNVALRNALAA